jgi:galactokinase
MTSMNAGLSQIVIRDFQARLGSAPEYVVRAPGRVNLIGEHTDYNDGFVMPMAIDRATWIALRPRNDGKVRLRSIDLDESIEIDLAHLERGSKGWRAYPEGVAWALQQAGFELRGWEGIVTCDVPMGAGLSSSASFELATARALASASGLNWDAPQMAILCQTAENQWVGVNCGIMDQMISAVGKKGHAVLIDCRDLTNRAVPLPSGTSVIIMDTSTRRGLVDSAYNERRAQCEAAARFFGVAALRDVGLDEFHARANELDPVTRRRARHVISENQRTLEAAKAMELGEAENLGQLINASHDSLRDDFEVTNAQLDQIVSIARKLRECLGARMTGAGFGGCALALVRRPAADVFMAEVARQYKADTGLTPSIYHCEPSNGAEVCDSHLAKLP